MVIATVDKNIYKVATNSVVNKSMTESPSISSERLFSLDSDDTSYVQHFDFINGLKTQEEDIQNFLASSDGDIYFDDFDNTSDSVKSLDSEYDTPQSLIYFDDLIPQLNKLNKSASHCNVAASSTSSDFLDLESNNLTQDSISFESPLIPLQPGPFLDYTKQTAFNFLDDKEISKLIEGETILPSNSLREKQEDINEDIIACFNVRNKYDHITAAELFVQENLSFLSIQEPFCSQHKVSESWKAYRMLELQSARIRCFETPYQVILFDTWKWGGKILYPFESKQYGRVTSIAFNFSKKQKIGFISVYAPTNALQHSPESSSNTTLQITSDIIAKIKSKWEYEHPDIQIIVLGDMQETMSLSNRDNIGNYRQLQAPEGVLNLLQNSHDSIVRKIDGTDEYITRFGSEGGRGLDHIFIPNSSPLLNWIIDAKVQRQKGAEFFPSDHSLITCTFRRFGQNNNEGSLEKIKFDYRKVYSIKLKQSGHLGEVLELNDNQFKDCVSFKQQEKLFSIIRTLTNNSSNFTKARLDDLQDRIKNLYKSLWDDGIRQNVNGVNNSLVDINEEHATELAFVLKKFNEGIEEAMHSWKLDKIHSANDAAGKTRGNLRRKKGFKLFANLPASTKLYYLKQQIMSKMKLVNQKIYWLQEHSIRSKHNSKAMDAESFWKGFSNIFDCKKLVTASNTVHGLILAEMEERVNHIEAIQFKQFENKLNKKCANQKSVRKPSHAMRPVLQKNHLDMEEKTTKKLNFWLTRSKCGQTFNLTQNKSIFESLVDEKLHSWSNPISEIHNLKWDLNSETDLLSLNQSMSTAKSDLRKLYSNITRMQSQYRKDILSYFLDSSQISDFTRKVLPKSRSAPAAHSLIWDSKLEDFRSCLDEAEEMIATSQFHGKWMGNTSAPEVCAYAKLIRKGRLGCRGIHLSPQRKVTKKDFDTLLPHHKNLPKHIKDSFLRAHSTHTAALFKEPKQDKKELFYPFFLTSAEGDMNDDEPFIKNFWKCLARIPGKARHEGFQMSVIGRLGKRWGDTLLDITKLILIMRFMPPELRKMARFPIPKPGKSNEYRPISLCNDLYCYINAISTSYSSLGIEKADILHDGMYAYRRGRGCSSLVTTELCFREDCREHNLPVLQLDEDEEKFFDRVPVEILLAAMRTNGFPRQGFLELKASCMQEKVVEIITAQGSSYAKFVCGLEQGNPDSPTISNLVIKLKHDIWQSLNAEAKAKLKSSHDSDGKYMFQTIDTIDGPVTLSRIGYCDDNSKFCCVKNEKDLLFLAKYFIQVSGDLSMVTKIGRKSSKCELQFFNISADLAYKIDSCWSTAWSYVSDSPIEEAVPYKIHMKMEERKKFYNLIDYFNLDDIQQQKWDKIIHPKPHKHLGLKCTLGADTSASSIDTLTKIHGRLNNLNVANMEVDCQRKCSNMLCSTMHSFAPLQVGYKTKDLADIDHCISNLLLRKNGMTKTDCRHRLYIPEKCGGVGFISLLDQDIISNSRELEIISNLNSLDGRSFRSRIKAIPNYDIYGDSDEMIINHVKSSIEKLAKYGLFFQDKFDDIVNNILANLNASGKYPSVGTEFYKDGNRYSIGSGKQINLNLSYGGPIHRVISTWKRNNWTFSKDIELQLTTLRLQKSNLIQIKNEVLEKRFLEIAGVFSCWEWTNNFDFTEKHIPKSKNKWRFIDIPLLIRAKLPESYLSLDDEHIRLEAANLLEINLWNNKSQGEECKFNKYDFFQHTMKTLIDRDLPMLVSTDGAHEHRLNFNEETGTITTSAFAISLCDIRNGETVESGEWQDRPSIPLFSRSTKLPSHIGTTPSDIASGELFAFAMSELSLPAKLPRIIITDSKSTRDILLAIRCPDAHHTYNRNYIRHIAGGVSKFIFNLFQDKFWQSGTRTSNQNTLYHEMQDNMAKMNEMARTWTDFSGNSNQDHWENAYWDNHSARSIWKIDSHQLNESGSAINTIQRYPNLKPNLCILSMNHHADVAADHIKKFGQDTLDIHIAYSALRFSITWEGKTIDRHVSNLIQDKIYMERIKRLRTKPTQGLLWRLFDQTTATWELLQTHKSLQRALLGFSRTHTRCLYKSETYRNNCLTYRDQHLCQFSLKNEISPPKSAQKLIDELAPCAWCDPSIHTNFLDKGNRKHAYLHCSHSNLSLFRTDVNGLVNRRIQKFFKSTTEAISWQFTEEIINNINSNFMEHQLNHSCRLKQPPAQRNTSYLHISELLMKWNKNNLHDAIEEDSCTILLDIFGITQERHPIQKGDEELGLIDATWLGLIPTFLDTIITDAIRRIKIEGSLPSSAASTLIEILSKSWKEIKTLILGRAVGLHRITGTTGKEMEQLYASFNSTETEKSTESPPNQLQSSSPISRTTIKRKKSSNKATQTSQHPMNPPLQSHSDQITPTTPPDTPSIPIIYTISPDVTPPTNSKRRKFSPTSPNSENSILSISSSPSDSPPIQLRACTGITCGNDSHFWCTDCNFNSNNIKPTIKQCLRCGRHMTAMRQAKEILSHILLSMDADDSYVTLIKFCQDNPTNLQFKYSSLMNLLNSYFNNKEEQSKGAKYTSKKVSDKNKLICKIIHKAITHSSKQGDVDQEIIIHASTIISKSFKKINTKLSTHKQAKHISAAIAPFLKFASPLSEARKTPSSKLLSSTQAQETNSAHTYLGGGPMSRAIEVIRARLSPSVFIAHADAYLAIQAWHPRQGWSVFARIFSVQRVINEKPNGTYIIPFFVGNDSAGHWITIVINKRRYQCEAWHIDSLGSTQGNRDIKSKIQQAFLPGRGQFIWKDHISKQQTECECGPRTITAIHTVERSINRGLSAEAAVQEASFLHTSNDNYDARAVRLEAALLVDQYTPSMNLSGRNRRRNREPTAVNENKANAKKKRRLEAKRKSRNKQCENSKKITAPTSKK